jgi:hypothetical protein
MARPKKQAFNPDDYEYEELPRPALTLDEDPDTEEEIANSPRTSYNGNPNLKPVGFQMEFTQAQIQEIVKCQADPIYFIETYIHIVTLDEGLVPFKPYQCQKKFIRMILDERKVIVKMGRQLGKTTCAAAAIVWYTLFHEAKTVSILAHKSAGAREVLERYQIMYESLPIWLQQGVKTWNKGNIELENGCKIFTAATTVSATRGKSVNWLYIDEAAMVPNNVAEQFFTSVYPTISSGKTTKILITSTPMGYNHYWKFWNEAEQGKNGFIPLYIPYWEIPGRDEAWAEEQRQALGDLKFAQEVLTDFLGSSKTLIAARTLATLSPKTPELTKMGMMIYQRPTQKRTYMIIVDVSEGTGGDYSAFSVVDVSQTPYEVVATYRDNRISPQLYPNVILKAAREYNNAFVLVEFNSVGGQVLQCLHEDLEYDNLLYTAVEKDRTYLSAGYGGGSRLGVKTSKAIKKQGCLAMKNMVEEQQLLVFDSETISEFSTFIERNGTFKADDGAHDDLTMTLVLFGWASTQTLFKDLTDTNIREKMYAEQMKQVEDETIPFALVDNGIDNQEAGEVVDGDLWISNFVWNDDYGRWMGYY